MEQSNVQTYERDVRLREHQRPIRERSLRWDQ